MAPAFSVTMGKPCSDWAMLERQQGPIPRVTTICMLVVKPLPLAQQAMANNIAACGAHMALAYLRSPASAQQEHPNQTEPSSQYQG